MSEEPDLEDRLESTPETANQSLLNKIGYHAKYFVVDGSANVLFYTPVMAFTEYISGMEPNEITTSRTIGASTAFLTGYGYSLFRGWWAKTFGVDTQSSGLKKKVIDTTVALAATVPVYAPMLYVAGASPQEMAVALVTGSVVAAASGWPFGYVLDKWRIFWGLEAVLHK